MAWLLELVEDAAELVIENHDVRLPPRKLHETLVGGSAGGELESPDSLHQALKQRAVGRVVLDRLGQAAERLVRRVVLQDVEDEALVDQRLEKLKSDIMVAWQELNCCYELAIEPEIFWRRGGPVDSSKATNR